MVSFKCERYRAVYFTYLCSFIITELETDNQVDILHYYGGPQIENDNGVVEEENDGDGPKMINYSDGLLQNELQTSA